VTGEAILGANIFRDFFAGIATSWADGPPPTKELRRAREVAFAEMEQVATERGATLLSALI
jgi:uncharacterized protein YbjQ (UPF0145 family)